MNIRLTRRAGYISTRTISELNKAGHSAIVVDSFVNSQPEALKGVAIIISKEEPFIQAECRDRETIELVFTDHKIDAFIIFVGFKTVGKSEAKPLEYNENNMRGVFVIVDVMRRHECKNIIFSSSPTVYSDQQSSQSQISALRAYILPYGWTKSVFELMQINVQETNPEWNVVVLRYLNLIGALKSKLIGEHLNGIPNNLMPNIPQTAICMRNELDVFGNNYDIYDGTSEVSHMDVNLLASGNVSALKAIQENKGLVIDNLYNSHCYPVYDVVKVQEKVNDMRLPYITMKDAQLLYYLSLIQKLSSIVGNNLLLRRWAEVVGYFRRITLIDTKIR